MLGPANHFDLRVAVPGIQVPIAFFQGRHDVGTSPSVVERYAAALDAPPRQVAGLVRGQRAHAVRRGARRFPRGAAPRASNARHDAYVRLQTEPINVLPSRGDGRRGRDRDPSRDPGCVHAIRRAVRLCRASSICGRASGSGARAGIDLAATADVRHRPGQPEHHAPRSHPLRCLHPDRGRVSNLVTRSAFKPFRGGTLRLHALHGHRNGDPPRLDQIPDPNAPRRRPRVRPRARARGLCARYLIIDPTTGAFSCWLCMPLRSG